jgi:type I restriction enzyme S subunit
MSTESHNFPSGWTTARLALLCDVLIGGTPSRNKQEFWDADKSGKNVWVSIADLSKLNGKYISDSSEYISDEGVRRSNVKKVLPGTVLMSFKLSIGKVAIAKTPLFTNEAIAAFNIKQPDRIVSDYLYYLLPTLEYETDQAIKGKTLNKEKLNEVELTLPPVGEQKKIAEIISTVDNEIQKTDEIITATVKLKSGLMQKFFEEASGETVRLSEVIKITNGQVDPKQEPYKGMYLLAPNHIESGTGRILERATAESQCAISGKYFVEKGDVVYSKIRPYLMKVAIADQDCLCSADMYPLKAHGGMSDQFLFYLLLSERFTNFANSISARTGIPKLNRDELGNYSFSLPSKDRQDSITSILLSIDGKISINLKIKEQLLYIKKGLMQDFFSGKVRVKT